VNLVSLLKLFLTNEKIGDNEYFINNLSIDTVIKFFSLISLLCFIIGVFCTSVYHSLLSLRPFEPLRVQQIFLGFFYFSFFIILILIPTRMGLKSKLSWLIQFFGFICLIYNEILINYLLPSLGLVIDSNQAKVLISEEIVIVLSFFGSVLIFRILSSIIKSPKVNFNYFIFLFFIGVFFSFYTFSYGVYQRIPQALGGGKYPIVRIEFNENADYSVTSLCDISHGEVNFQGYKYYARLIHIDNNIIYLSSVFWYRLEVFEIDRNCIKSLIYSGDNPTTYKLEQELKRDMKHS